MTEMLYLKNDHLDERDMNSEYRQAEENYRTQAAQLWDRNEEIKKQIRKDTSLTPEQRLDRYMQEYEAQIEQPWSELATSFIGPISAQCGRDERFLAEGVGDRFADHVISLSDKSVEELEAIMKTAKRTNQPDLVRAVAQVALDKDAFGTYQEWATSDPERAAALQRLRSTPPVEQLGTRTKAMKPPKAKPTSLEPTYEDRRKASEREAAAEAAKRRERQEFYKDRSGYDPSKPSARGWSRNSAVAQPKTVVGSWTGHDQ